MKVGWEALEGGKGDRSICDVGEGKKRWVRIGEGDGVKYILWE